MVIKPFRTSYYLEADWLQTLSPPRQIKPFTANRRMGIGEHDVAIDLSSYFCAIGTGAN